MSVALLAGLAAAAGTLLAGCRARARLAPARRLHDGDGPPRLPLEVLPADARTQGNRSPTSPAPVARRHRTPSWPGRRRRARLDEHVVATWCQHVARGARTGSSLPAAFETACTTVPAVGIALEPVLLAQKRGASLATALGRWQADDPSLTLAAASVRACARLGGPAAEPLDRVAATLHSRAAARAERRVHSSQAEMSAKVLTVLPIAVLALLLASDADVRAALGLAAVRACLAVGLVLNGLGWWWMRRVVTAPARPPRRAARRRLDAAARSLPEGIEVIVACLHAGVTPPQVIDAVGDDLPAPLRPAFGAVAQRMQRGHRFADALAELPALIGPQAHGLADAMAAADRYGLPLGPVLDRLAAEAAEARRRLGEADARRLPVRLAFPLVLTVLPSFVLIAIAPAVIGAISTLDVPTW